MAGAQPLPKSVELATPIWSVYYAIGEVGDFQLRQWERDLQNQIKRGEDLSKSFELLSVISRVRGDTEQALLYANNMLHHSHGAIGLLNALKLMHELGDLSRTDDLLEQLVKRSAGDKKALRLAMIISKIALRLTLADEVFGMIVKLGPPWLPLDTDFNPPGVESLLKGEASLGLPPGGLAERLDCVLEALKGRQVQPFGLSLRHMHDGGALYQVLVRESPEECGRLDFAIAEALCERFDETGVELMPFICRPISDFRHSNFMAY